MKSGISSASENTKLAPTEGYKNELSASRPVAEVGGVNTENYSNMTITQTGTGTTAQILVSMSLNPNGSELSFPLGSHELVLEAISDGWRDTVQVLVNCNNCW